MKLILLDSSNLVLLKKKCCFACYLAVDLSIVLSFKSEFKALLFEYCSKNVKPNFSRLLVKFNF